MDRTDILHQRISKAAESVSLAERELEAALATLASNERADKQMISPRLESAFSRLAVAREALAEALEAAG